MKIRVAVLFLLGVFLAVVLPSAGTDRVGDYEVHEWGVLAGCDDGEAYLLTSRPFLTSHPPGMVVVKEPVLYFHSRDGGPFSLKVSFRAGTPTETYPVGEKNGRTVQWKKVSFVKAAGTTKGLFDFWDSTIPVSLEKIIPTLNDVDADEIVYNGTKSRFIFYEGEVPFTNKVAFQPAAGGREVVVANNGEYPVFDLYVFLSPDRAAYLPRLDAGAKVKVAPGKAETDFAAPLKKLGFTDKEAAAFAGLWEDSFLWFGRLVYRLAEEECDGLVELEFDPRPKKLVRALYVLVKG